MKRATVTLPDSLVANLDAWIHSQSAPPSFTVVVQAALAEYLARRGAGWPARPLHITPAENGSGLSDVSLRHDEYFAQE
jgi:hypothetical protein